MTNYHEANDEANKAILQALVEESQDTDIAAVIQCYNIGVKGTEIRKEMAKLKVSPLQKCASYLGIDAKKLKAQIITDIMTRINSLLRDLCGICGDYFNNELQEKPLFNCIICRQGCHRKCFEPISTLFADLNDNQKRAMQFICTSCHSDYSADEAEETVENAPKVKKSPTKVTEPPSTDELEDEQDKNQQPDFREEHPSSPRSHEGLIHGDSSGDNEHTASDDSTQIPVCPAYKWQRCPNYETCQYRHPPRCWNWLTDGKCSFKKKCRFHHPPLCYNSLWEKRCLKPECKFFHLAKTQRKIEDELLKNSLTPSAYGAHSTQFPELPQAQYSQPPNHDMPQPQQPGYNQPPQQQQTAIHNAQTSTQPLNTRPQYQQQQPNNHPNQAQSSFSHNDISFLAKTIKEAIKEDLAKELVSLKQDLEMKIHHTSMQQTMPTNTMPQPQIAPFMISQPVPGMMMK